MIHVMVVTDIMVGVDVVIMMFVLALVLRLMLAIVINLTTHPSSATSGGPPAPQSSGISCLPTQCNTQRYSSNLSTTTIVDIVLILRILQIIVVIDVTVCVDYVQCVL